MDTPRTILTRLLVRPMALAELTTATGSSMPTLRRAIRDLERERWVCVAGRESRTGGRPANLFGIDPTVHTVVGVHLVHPGMQLVATDVVGTVLDQHAPEALHDLEPDAVHAAILAYLARLAARFPERRVIGLALATPGYVDPVSGTVIAIGRVPRWINLPICERLHDATGLRVTIGNDVDAMANAEFGLNGDHRTFAYAGVGEGVKFSMFLDGVPYVGPFGNAGLVSQRLLAGCADEETAALLTVRGLVEAVGQRERGQSGLRPSDRGDQGHPAWLASRYRAILASAAAGEPDATAVVGAMADLLGAQVASFVHLIQPSLLVIGGALAGAPERVLADVETALRRRLPPLLDNNLIVRRARMSGDLAAAIGSTRVFVHRLLHDDVTPLVGRASARP